MRLWALSPSWVLLSLFLGASDAAGATARERATLAVVNIGRHGWEAAAQVQQALGGLSGGWARQPGIAEHLAGRPNPGGLPGGDVGRDLHRLIEELRQTRRPSPSAIYRLGQLLAVDYLLLVIVRDAPTRVSGRLFSVRRQASAPQGYEGPIDARQLRAFLRAQAHVEPTPVGSLWSRWKRRWWLLAIAAGVAGLTVGLSLATRDSPNGDLQIRIHR